ncbi:MAG: thioesterase family protein [Bacteroidia bacterium]
MINPFSIGDLKVHFHTVGKSDLAEFRTGKVHNVFSTFALGREVEWCCRLFVLEMKEHDEQGIGTFLNIKHKSPALLGSNVRFEAELVKVEKSNVICKFRAFVDNRLIAEGEQGQKILKKEQIAQLFDSIK